MIVENDILFFFSTEGYSSGLPVRTHFMKKLKAKNDREAILVKCDHIISIYKTKYLVFVPKLVGSSFFSINSNDPVFVYVLDGSEYLDKEYIDLSKGTKIIIDLGGVALSLESASKWQVRADE
jgi:hypothetical protein